VQRALLKPMEETEVDLKVAHDPVSQIQAIEHYRRTGKKEKRTLNTRHILFIVSGAFNDLDKIVKERLSKKKIGFHGKITSKKEEKALLKQVTAEDLIKYGFESEFVGRLPVVAVLEELTAGDLYAILRNPNNPIITSKKRDFWSYGIVIEFEDEALRLLADLAAQEKIGARGLVSVIERVLIQFEKRLPSMDLKEFVVTPEVVQQPSEELARLLANPYAPEPQERFRKTALREQEILREFIWKREEELKKHYHLPLTSARVDLMVTHYYQWDCDLKTSFQEMGRLYEQVRSFEDRFHAEHDIQLHFDEEAVDDILRQALEGDTSAYVVCSNLSGDLEYALKLVRDRTSQDHFILTREALADLDSYLNRLIQNHYQTQATWIRE